MNAMGTTLKAAEIISTNSQSLHKQRKFAFHSFQMQLVEQIRRNKIKTDRDDERTNFTTTGRVFQVRQRCINIKK